MRLQGEKEEREEEEEEEEERKQVRKKGGGGFHTDEASAHNFRLFSRPSQALDFELCSLQLADLQLRRTSQLGASWLTCAKTRDDLRSKNEPCCRA